MLIFRADIMPRRCHAFRAMMLLPDFASYFAVSHADLFAGDAFRRRLPPLLFADIFIYAITRCRQCFR